MPGPYNITPVNLHDRSISLTGSAANDTVPGNEGRLSLLIQNLGSNSMAVNLAGGTASIGGLGSITLTTAATVINFGPWVPHNPISVKGTANDVILILEGDRASITGQL